MSAFETILAELEQLEIVDPHTHIDPHAPAATSLADILTYHYYTELAHSAGLAREAMEGDDRSPEDRVAAIVAALAPLHNTVQYAWLVDIAQTFFGFEDPVVDETNWERLDEAVRTISQAADWPDQVLARSRTRAVFLTNDFDDPLEGFDTTRYIPCLRTDELVLGLTSADVRQRLEQATGIEASSANCMEQAIARLFDHFVAHGARACAISLPPSFEPRPVSAARADRALGSIWRQGAEAAREDRQAAARFVFWTLAQQCQERDLPFDLMIGVCRNVYRAGVHQGRDLFDQRVSLTSYAELFNAFPRVTFPVSVLATTSNQELVAFAWIFPNVVAQGHWWYSNLPAYIEADLSARLDGVPASKLVGYYSDMYKLEFGLPKFRMYRRVLARVLAERFVAERGWSESQAIALGRTLLVDNVARIFGV